MLPADARPHGRIVFDDHRPGGQCRTAPFCHPRPAPGPAGTRRAITLTSAARTGTGEHGGDADAGRLRLGCAATASTTPMRCGPVGRSSVLGCMVKAPSTLGAFLRSFRWERHVRQHRPREAAPVAGPGMGRWGRPPATRP